MLDIKQLKKWFLKEKRDLPWREKASPYAVWVSEVMLQQTLSAVVIPYFLRWMEKFPTIEILAKASLDDVIKEWEGLGYYSRARNLHEGARYVLEHFNGELPQEAEELKKIKGLGPYTIGAIRSFAFHKKAHCVDGNVIRVIARVFMLKGDITKPKTVKEIQSIVEKILPDQEPWVISEALIELGAIICQKKANCQKCPLKMCCQSHLHGEVENFPVRTKRPKIEKLYRSVAVICSGDKYLLKQGKKGEIMHGLHEFPYFETDQKGLSSDDLKSEIKKAYSLDISYEKELLPVKHTFTRYRVSLFPQSFVCDQEKGVDGYFWVGKEQMKKLAFSSGHKKIYLELIS